MQHLDCLEHQIYHISDYGGIPFVTYSLVKHVALFFILNHMMLHISQLRHRNSRMRESHVKSGRLL